MGPEREMRVGTLLSTLAINDSLALVGRAVDLASQSTYVRYGIVLNLLLITACTELYAKIDGKPPSNTARSTFHMTTVQKQMLKRLTSTSSQLKPIPITKTPPQPISFTPPPSPSPSNFPHQNNTSSHNAQFKNSRNPPKTTILTNTRIPNPIPPPPSQALPKSFT